MAARELPAIEGVGSDRKADIAGCRMLHIDGFDIEAAAFAAGVAREHGVPVSLDVDTVYSGFERC